jgi:hypothetical protein
MGQSVIECLCTVYDWALLLVSILATVPHCNTFSTQLVLNLTLASECCQSWHFWCQAEQHQVSNQTACPMLMLTLPLLIDISWIDWAYKSSTCDVMYCQQRRNLYYGVKFRNTTVFVPLLRSSPFIHCPYIAERTQKVVYIVRCLWHFCRK